MTHRRLCVAASVLAALLLAAAPAAAQPDYGREWKPDSLGFADDTVRLPVEPVLALDRCQPYGLRVVAAPADAAPFRRFRGCADADFSALEDRLLVRVRIGGDCHARFGVAAFRSERRREYRVALIRRYGGCRAGGWHDGWYALPPLPPGWTVAFTDVRVERGDPWPDVVGDRWDVLGGRP